jgi:hypothetical protein
MKSLLSVAALLAAVTLVTPALADAPKCEGSEFTAFRTEFTAAANANDKAKLARMIAFPVEYWATMTKGNAQTDGVKTEAEFLQRYDTLFTAFMKKNLKTAKLLSLPEGRCALTWHDANSEFSFEFQYVPNAGYRMSGYDVGAY